MSREEIPIVAAIGKKKSGEKLDGEKKKCCSTRAAAINPTAAEGGG